MTIQLLNELYNWQGVTPSDWALVPMRYCVALRQNGDWGDELDDDEEGSFCLRAADFNYDMLGLKDKKSFTKRKYSALRFRKVKLRSGDLLVEKSGGGEKVPVGRAILFRGGFEACFSNFLERIRVLPSISPRFFFYWWTAGYQSSAFVPYFNQTTGIQNLNSTELLSRCSIALPPLEEQERISDAIDAQYSLINKSVITLSEEVDVLEHYRASVIHEAVTKGLDSNVPMKPSGVDWIGDIPKGWECKKLKYCYKFITGFTPDTSNEAYYDNDGFTWVSIADLTSAGMVVNTSEMGISKMFVKEKHPQITPVGSLLYSFKLSVGKCAFAGCPLYTNEAIASFLPSGENSLRYLYYASSLLINNANENIYSAKLLNRNLIANAPISLPPVAEQITIADYLDARIATIDTVLEIKRKQIDVLKRRRQSLIYEYATGKRRVGREI